MQNSFIYIKFVHLNALAKQTMTVNFPFPKAIFNQNSNTLKIAIQVVVQGSLYCNFNLMTIFFSDWKLKKILPEILQAHVLIESLSVKKVAKHENAK